MKLWMRKKIKNQQTLDKHLLKKEGVLHHCHLTKGEFDLKCCVSITGVTFEDTELLNLGNVEEFDNIKTIGVVALRGSKLHQIVENLDAIHPVNDSEVIVEDSLSGAVVDATIPKFCYVRLIHTSRLKCLNIKGELTVYTDGTLAASDIKGMFITKSEDQYHKPKKGEVFYYRVKWNNLIS